ncbi:hypothetical protein I8752_10305 [Nostocaceae cyanobacterium CENA369]|uniref:Uncharacterized protein n=1 Tax=Dendronalium phyllosphericum CENA369 TaxID=1725256 RepID=A0A8J7LGY0_9NOST|nr:hypothetical protein [Dendronalium phyllosphericum]MBH8573399.1 hypothetical protein [Dendronalium phyllosphericum CENA369]
MSTDFSVVDNANSAWMHESNTVENNDSFSQKVIDGTSLIKVQMFLDRAIVYAYYAVKSERQPPNRTYTRWVWRLAGAYHSSRHTSRLMEKAAQNFAALGRQDLAKWATQKAKEEAGHDQLALLDIQSMGYDAEAVVQVFNPSPIRDYVNYFTQIVEATNPIDCIGLCYASERLGTFIGEEYIQSVEALLPKGIHATRWLRVHSSVGSEVKHVDDIVELVAHLTPQERNRVARACYETALLRFMPPKEDYILDEEIQGILKPLELSRYLQVQSV